MAPEWAVTPLAVLATMATVIASQALISGAFSLTAQAVQLDYLPRLGDPPHVAGPHRADLRAARQLAADDRLRRRSCIGFRTSSNLAAAYGIAVTATMAITTLLFYRVVVDRWGWSRRKALAVIVPLFAGRPRLPRRQHPQDPRRRLAPDARRPRPRDPDDDVATGTGHRRPRSSQRGHRRTDDVVAEARRRRRRPRAGHGDLHVQGPGLRPAGDDLQPPSQPRAARDDDRAVGDRVATSPRVEPAERVDRRRRSPPGVLPGRRHVRVHGRTRRDRRAAPASGSTVAPLDVDDATFFIGRETVASIPEGEMPRWREHLFVVLNRGAASASRFYQLPSKQVFEVGTQVDI